MINWQLPAHILTDANEIAPHLLMTVEKYEKLEFPDVPPSTKATSSVKQVVSSSADSSSIHHSGAS